MRRWWWLSLWVVGACAKEEPEPEPDAPIGSCGTPTYGIEIAFQGVVETPGGARIEGAEIELEDRQLQPPTVLGTAVSDSQGRWQMDATDISSWPDCWLTLLDYRLVGEKDGYEGEMEVNRFMWESIQAETYAVNLDDRPLVLEAPE